LIGLYIHVPFCARACPYCDFDFEVGRNPDVEAYLAGLQAELDARSIGAGTALRTVYVGGGTPTMLGAQGLLRLLRWVTDRFDVRAAVETTVEANPEHLDARMVGAMVEAGVSRVSVGLQTLDRGGLVQLGRAHDARRGLDALAVAVEAGLRTSADLIVGWPSQSPAALAADLQGVVGTGVEHVSVYALTVEAGTPWEAMIRSGRRSAPDPDAQADALQTSEARLAAAGFEHYEVSSYARPGGRSRHNLGYWSWESYLGLGPSAASATFTAQGVQRRRNHRGWAAWRADPGGGEHEWLRGVEAAAEGLWTGLRRLEDGVDATLFAERFGVERDWLEARVAPEVARGNLRWFDEGAGVRIERDRWLFHDEISARLI
jgi:oxygen-independent coproporphyrinogen III oxidase